MLNDKSILITGGTGSFGKRLAKKVLDKYKLKRLVIFSRDELKQFEMQNEIPHKNPVRYFLGDVRDYKRVCMAMEDIDIVIHAAALKQVPAAEYNPFEAIKTNVIGAQNIIDAALSTKVKRIIALSTDKAAAPINLYGATKLCSDKLFVSANNYRGKKDLISSVVRYGNVVGSRGSVIPFFLAMKETGSLPVTDPRMTRFSITLNEGVDFVLNCINKMWGGEIFVPKIPSYKILDVVRAIDKNIKYKITGIRPGEKLHEELITKTDSLNTIEFKDYFVILPSFEPSWSLEKFLNESGETKGKKVNENFYYDSFSNTNFLSIDEIEKLISNET